MIKHAWDCYVKYTMGENELKPISKQRNPNSILGNSRLGATLVDSLDTLYIAGLHEEFDVASKWIRHNFNIEQVINNISRF